jgi:hypothetical protein
LRFTVPRFRCSRCRLTATALPDEVLPGARHDLNTVATTLATYLESPVGYRGLPFQVLGVAVPADMSVSTVWGQPEAPSPTPATCFRWLARFASGARDGWRVAVVALQAGQEYKPPEAPTYLKDKARSDAKRQLLADAWHTLDAWRVLARRLGRRAGSPVTWARAVLHAPGHSEGGERANWPGKPPPPA